MDTLVHGLFWFALLVLILMLLFEIGPLSIREGFASTIDIGDSKFWAKLVPRRGDVGPELEESGLFRDNRYFSGYVDVQRFGTLTDFCRMVQKGNEEGNKFLACALGGTENLSSTSFRSQSVKDGFVLGRDDYMRDVDGDGRSDYCRIVKKGNAIFQSECNLATETGFTAKLIPDLSPPEDIALLLQMYQGCVFWLRLRDDMLDYAQNLYLNTAGNAEVPEKPPRPTTTEGLQLNGINQFVRIGDDPYLGFGNTVQLRNLRALHFWVRFDEFTNNAHILDFGNGAGIDNVWVGILYRGNQGIDAESERRKSSLICGDGAGGDVLPTPPSGQQGYEVTTPQELMKTSSANVEEFTCEGFAVAPKSMTKMKPKPGTQSKSLQPAKTADMCYEIWDRDQRKMRIVIPQMFVLNEWTHVVITAQGSDSFRPDIAVYKNGRPVYLEPSGWLPQENATEKNYIGKSNWTDESSQYGNKDELLKGAVFDVRGYNVSLAESLIKSSFTWGRKMLGLETGKN